ncbi:hypothetical protein N657DRAFT_195931 [Parathielavia appendiculata]|uniref:SPT2 chromatin protein n=1 Tax=Parathielavia appendiculata TaxID=2587402 RepID=A0AAN6U8W4_9PEZI|nr:hypothetical protein N657DRAFT_195931 [Parathielavia appendiculata]
MPILDLLASITGETPKRSPKPIPNTSIILPKRKAEDEIRPVAAKVARTGPAPEKATRPVATLSKPLPRPLDTPLGFSSDSQSSRPQSSVDKKASSEKPSAATFKAAGTGATLGNGIKPLPARPLPNRPSPTDSNPLKKRSFAEIMARAKANSEQRESLGKIQHKMVERSMTMKERKEMKAGTLKRTKMEARKVASGQVSAAGTSSREAAKGPGARNGLPSGAANAKKTPPVEEKKVKKAALATTGYTGTARPRPGVSTTAKPGAPGRPGSETRARDRPKYGGPLSGPRNRYEEDDEMDDFIVDDEDEAETSYGGPGYRYNSYEDESDMEAGLTDIEDEEQRAERQARREDLEQEALERRLKQEKEERRRRLLAAAKSKAAGR